MDVSNNFICLIPIELFDNFFNYLPDIRTMMRFKSTCKFILQLQINYKIYLISTGLIGLGLEWSRDIQIPWKLEINNLAHYYQVRKYQHLLRYYQTPKIKIFGFYTNIPFNILNSPYFKCLVCETAVFLSRYNYRKIIDFTLIEHITHRQVIFETDYLLAYILIKYFENNSVINLYLNSEIFHGRHSIYNNIEVAHTATANCNIDNTRYFISFYTEALDFTLWKNPKNK